MKKIFLTTFTGLVIFSQLAHADLNSATGRIVGNLGSKQAIDATGTCDISTMVTANGGNLATPNIVLCLMKNQSLTAATASTGVTSSVTIGGSPLSFHYILSAPGPTIDGQAYDYELKIWTCGSGCSVVTGFLPTIYTVFNANSSGTINNGILINHFNADSGTIQGSSFIKWDTGSATATKSITMNMVDCHAVPTGAAYVVYNRTGDQATLNDLYYNGTSVMRSALAWNFSTDLGNWQSDSISSAGGDSPAWGGGFSRTVSGGDYTYSAGSVDSAMTIHAYPTAMSGANLTSNQALTCSATAGVPAVANGSNILSTTMTAMGGMTTNPPNL